MTTEGPPGRGEGSPVVPTASDDAPPPPRPGDVGVLPTTGAVAVGRPGAGGWRTVRRALVAAVLAGVITAGVLRVLALVLLEDGPQALVVGVALALLPVLLVLAVFLWLDRYEAEPAALLVLALGWGAGVATTVALAVNGRANVALDDGGPPGLLTLAVVAPLTEEVAKGLGVVAVLLLRRREFDGVVDGIVYAGMVGIGFALVENVLYFSAALVQGGTAQLAVTFVLRAVVAPFAHPLFTMAVGVGLGVAVGRRSRARWLLPLAGLVVAVALHGLWNASTFLPGGFPVVYVLLQVPVFTAAVVLAVVARRRERRLLREHLDVYARAGWLTWSEAAMVASLPERRRARRWAAGLGPDAGEAMADFQHGACELAFLRERLRRGTAAAAAREEERRALADLWRLRERFLVGAVAGATAPGAPADAPADAGAPRAAVPA
ncbi:PrsW family intramembrane metalloprotease [Pseudokineococcus basanitobsidens]|uniref:PrsW family intramembrane metalloprotease n=1 Tax=Pseudokineococcus basanitobsidens TaxID=1926649 RepID=A0ABU8RJI9_9ACTN